MGGRWSDFGARVRFGWDFTRFFIRIFIEYVVSAWLLGIAPFVAHLAAALEQPNSRFDWIPNDLYLFVMVIGAGAAWETFKDRESEGPMRLIAGVAGVAGLLIGAWAYGSLEVGAAPVNPGLRAAAFRVIEVLLAIYLSYRLPFMTSEAVLQAKSQVVQQ
jgi:hypothetical protein